MMEESCNIMSHCPPGPRGNNGQKRYLSWDFGLPFPKSTKSTGYVVQVVMLVPGKVGEKRKWQVPVFFIHMHSFLTVE